MVDMLRGPFLLHANFFKFPFGWAFSLFFEWVRFSSILYAFLLASDKCKKKNVIRCKPELRPVYYFYQTGMNVSKA